MINKQYNSMASLKEIYREVDRDRKKQAYDAMKQLKRESKANALIDDKQLASALYGAILTGYKTTIGQQQ